MNSFVDIINSQIASPIIYTLIPIFIILDIAALAVLIFSFKKALRFRPDFDLGIKKAKQLLSLREKMIMERWNSAVAKLAINSPEAAKMAIIEADNLVNNALKELGFAGEDLADRLANLELEDLEHDEEVFVAHRLRKELTDTPGFVVSVEDGKRAVAAYEAFLKELGLLGEPGESRFK